jgi:tol-pal system protein YbgF
MQRTIVAAVLGALMLPGAGAAPAAAADREHRVMMAELRMLQEQTQQLQQTLNSLNDTLKALNAKIDDQSGVTRKAFADQRLVIDTLGEGIRIVREKVDDTNVRIATLTQEVESIRTTVASQPAPAATDPNAPPVPVDPNAPPATGTTPKQLFDLAFGDYTAGQWDLAIQGFQTYLKAYPKSPMSPQAAFYIGQAHYAAGRFKDAIAAYDELIAAYPGTESVAEAYYKRGLAFERLGQGDRARQSLEFVVKNFPDSNTATLARQALERLSKPGA